MKAKDILTLCAMTAGVAGAVAQCADVEGAWFGVLACGLTLFFIRLSLMMREEDFRLRRLYGILMFSATSLCVCAYLMMKGRDYWLIPLMISAVLELYASLRGGDARSQKRT